MKNAFLNGATLVFDLDGTLVDTAPDLVRTLNHVLGGLGCAAVPESKIRSTVGFGARRIIMEGLAVAGKSCSDEEIDALFEQFLDHYGDNVAVKSAPYPNAVDVLDAALKAGAKLGVCTNKREDLSRKLLTELQIHDHFGAIIGRDTLEVYKPDPRHLTETILRSGGRQDRAVMIGDMPVDIATARAAGIPVVAVSFGYSEHPAHSLGADAVIDDYAELMALLPSLLQSR